MATTKIWPVRGRLDHVLNYSTDEEKTANPDFSSADLQALRDVMNYTMQDYKTEYQYYITGLNCSPETARQEMMITKKQYRKEGGIIAYHGYQSFAPGEVTPEQCHEIGVKLAQKLWGNRFEVIVTTHLDKEHLHNHFVLNSVSFKDGLRYYDCKATYAKMRRESDHLCREYRLSVIENPQPGRRPHYAAYLAELQSKPNWYDLIRADIDKAIAQSMTIQQFYRCMKEQGYTFKPGRKYFTLKPPGADYFTRIDRHFPDYSLENIRERILQRAHPSRSQPEKEIWCLLFRGDLNKVKRVGGLRGLYYHYCYLLGAFQKRPDRTLTASMRADVRKMQQISEQARLLCKNRIDTGEQLAAHRDMVEQQRIALCKERARLRYRQRKEPEGSQRDEFKKQIASLTKQIGRKIHERELCDGIAARSGAMRESIQSVRQQSPEKEGKTHELQR